MDSFSFLPPLPSSLIISWIHTRSIHHFTVYNFSPFSLRMPNFNILWNIESKFNPRTSIVEIILQKIRPWYDESEAGSKRHRNHREIVRHKSPPSLLPRLVALFRLYFTNGAIIMTFKRRCADCTATGITFPNRLIYLALSWTNNNRRGYREELRGRDESNKECPCTLLSLSSSIRDAFRFPPSNRQNYRFIDVFSIANIFHASSKIHAPNYATFFYSLVYTHSKDVRVSVANIKHELKKRKIARCLRVLTIIKDKS